MGPGTELTLPLLPIAIQEPASVPLFLLSHERVPEVPSGANLVIPTSLVDCTPAIRGRKSQLFPVGSKEVDAVRSLEDGEGPNG